MDKLISEVKKKKEFSQLPDSLILKALELNKKDTKNTRSFLRKYFGVFLTNKVLKLKDESILKSHISSQKRNYIYFYEKLNSLTGKNIKTIIDLGCGANGFSYQYYSKISPNLSYLGIESTKQLVDKTNDYFLEKNFYSAKCVWLDLFKLKKVIEIIKEKESPRLIFLLQVVDALEKIENNYSKKLLLEIKKIINSEDFILISFSKKSISGKKNFYSNREWFKIFLLENFYIIEEFEMFEEKFFLIKK